VVPGRDSNIRLGCEDRIVIERIGHDWRRKFVMKMTALNMQASAFPAACCGVGEQFNKTALVPYMRKIPRSLLWGASK